jgi:hypothetical protein
VIIEMSTKEIEETRDKIASWLTEEGLFKEYLREENLLFQLAAEYPAKSGRHLSVIQPKGREDMVVVFSRIKLADQHYQALLSMPPKDKEQLIWRMRYDLLFRDSSFEMEPGGGDMRSIRFMREIYYDALSKNKLMEVIRENFKCELYVVWKFQEVFGDGQIGRVCGPPEPMYT